MNIGGMNGLKHSFKIQCARTRVWNNLHQVYSK